MKKIYSLSIVLLVMQFVSAQKAPFYESYTWDSAPKYEVADEEQSENMMALKDQTITEFYFAEKGNLTEFYLEHKVLWLNSDDKIEEYNKIYLPYSSASELVVNKARVINKDGSVIELDESKILTAEDEETKRKYKFFAFEGIEKGSFIEYYYVVRRYPNYKGKRLLLQDEYKKKNVSFDLYSPGNLVFKFKSYNNLPEVAYDTLSDKKLHWQLKLDELESLEDEEISAYNAYRQQLVYKLDRNLANNTNDIASYGNVAQNLYEYYYQENSKKTQKALDKFLKETKAAEQKDEAAKVRKLEFFIKNNVFLSKASGDNLSNIDNVIAERVANETGLIKLYIGLLRTMNIQHEMVFTTDRREVRFDQEFEANNFLNDFLLYFPKSKAFMSPSEPGSRFGFPPPQFTDNYGLFIKEITVGDFKSAVAKIKYIDPVGAEDTFDTMVVDVAFEEDNLTKSIIKFDRSFNGYYAMYMQPFMNLINDEDKEEMIEGMAKSIHEEIEITDKKIVDDNPELFGVKPLQFIIDFTSEAFVEKAGRKYLFKVGELIGQQMQLYQEKERKLPVEGEFNRSYFRTINVQIPEGYRIANLDDLNIDNVYSKDGKELLSFKSFYELQNGILKITADEHYRINLIETALYEEYRKVINSAADFNKITLVLEPAVSK